MTMKNYYFIALLMTTALLTSCGGKKTDAGDNIVTVKTATPSNVMASGEQAYPGTIEETNGTSLSFATAGTIKSLNITEGQNVRAGQLLGVVDATSTSNAVAMAHATTLQAKESLRQAEDAYKRMKLLHDNGSLPEIKWVETETKLSQARQAVQQAQASENIARKGLTDTRLTAPFSGYISKKIAETGQNVIPGQPVATLVKIDQVKVKITVPEEDVSKIKIGQQIMFNVSALNNDTFFGTVSERAVDADPMSRSYTIRALVQNNGHKLLPGMVCDVYTAIDKASMGMSLPANVIQIDVDKAPFVWVAENGKAKRKTVELGDNVGANIIIKSGLNADDKVIVEGQQKVSTGMAVRELGVKN